MLATTVLNAADHSAMIDDRLPTFDLSYVEEQLAAKPEFADWSPERFRNAIEEYRQFCFLAKHDSSAIPTKDADEIWHRHILNTRLYFSDCEAYFGHYLHHKPRPISKAEWRTMVAAYAKAGVPLAANQKQGDCDSGSCSGDGCTP